MAKAGWIIFGLVVVLFIAFFYPKNAGYHGGNIAGPSTEHPYSNKECTCIGIKQAGEIIPDAGDSTKCFGLPISCKCY